METSFYNRWEREISRRFIGHQEKLKVEKNRWIVERSELGNQIEEFNAHENHFNHIIYTT